MSPENQNPQAPQPSTQEIAPPPAGPPHLELVPPLPERVTVPEAIQRALDEAPIVAPAAAEPIPAAPESIQHDIAVGAVADQLKADVRSYEAAQVRAHIADTYPGDAPLDPAAVAAAQRLNQ